MTPESIPGVLPLAEALKAWSAPDLLGAVELAEAPFTAEHCDRHQREWLAEIVHHRLRPNEKRREPVEPRHRALEAAWYRLFVDFTRKIAAGEIVLCGRMARPFSRSNAELLPAAWADELLLYPRRDSVIFREDVYTDVIAAEPSTAASLAGRLVTARVAAGSVPLTTALREWADPGLIGEVCRRERDHTEFEMAGFPVHPLLSDLQDLTKPSDRRWMLGLPDFAQLLAAWEALENDFRSRLIRGEFHLQGVMAKPRRELQSEILPGVWAADYAFDFRRGAVRLDDARYVAVTASYGPAPQPGAVLDDVGDVGNGETGGHELVGATDAPASRRRGRKGAGPIIEEALRVHWHVLYPTGAPADPGFWTELARALIKRVARTALRPGEKFPKEDTVRRHLPEIYARLLAEKGGSSQCAQ